jgi:hypothetical protein
MGFNLAFKGSIISNLIHTHTTPEKYTREEASLSQSTRQNTIFNVFYKVGFERKDSSKAHFSIYILISSTG